MNGLKKRYNKAEKVATFSVTLFFIAVIVLMLINRQEVAKIKEKFVKSTSKNPAITSCVANDSIKLAKESTVKILSDTSVGSGFVIDDGLILTNEHVVRSNSKIRIIFADNTTIEGAVVSSDEYTDLALVRAEKFGLKALSF